MNKISRLFFLILGITVLTVIVGFWRYRYFSSDDSGTKNTAANGCDQPFDNCGAGKENEGMDSLSKKGNEDLRQEQRPEEQKAVQESSSSVSNDDSQSDGVSDENSKKFDSNDDEGEETNDDITVEIEPNDE